jgi:hypothetical protein
MDHPFDPTLKTLAELSPADWLPLAGRRRRRVTIVDSDVGTTVSGATDKVFRVHDDPEYLLHLDFESGHFHSDLLVRLRLYNSAFEYRHRRVVLSVPVLLRPEADSPQWNGLFESGLPNEVPVSTLRYPVVRVWQVPAEQLLTGGVGTLALAPISDVPGGDVRRVVGRMKERLSGPKAPRRTADIWAATYVLMGLRYSNDTIANSLFEEVLRMKESTTYQAIARQERAEEARQILLRQGKLKFGPPDATTRSALDAVNDLAQLHDLTDRLLSVDSWEKLLAPSGRRRRNGRRRSSS